MMKNGDNNDLVSSLDERKHLPHQGSSLHEVEMASVCQDQQGEPGAVSSWACTSCSVKHLVSKMEKH